MCYISPTPEDIKPQKMKNVLLVDRHGLFFFFRSYNSELDKPVI